MFKLGHHRSRPVDHLRPGLLHLMLDRIRALNANTRLLVRLLEEPNWADLRDRALDLVRTRIVH